MTEALYPWLQPYWRNLSDYLKLDHIPQALLITGKARLGKRQLAEAFAASLLCESVSEDMTACRQCHACHLWQSATHPDYLVVEPEKKGKDIGVDVIRGLLRRLSLKPQFEGRRVVLIDAAEYLNRAAANAFLKGLEEPGDRTTYILVTDQPSRLPLTIRSRCQLLSVTAVKSDVIHQWLQQQQIHKPDTLLMLANGSPLKAVEYAEKDYLKLAEQFFVDWLALLNQSQRVNVVSMVEGWLKQPVELEILMEWLCLWVAQLIKLLSGALPQSEFEYRLQEIKAQLNLAILSRYYQTLLNTRQLLATQLNNQLLLEKILIEWSQMSNAHG
jgi:DNA polymerase-3 subunit delta'